MCKHIFAYIKNGKKKFKINEKVSFKGDGTGGGSKNGDWNSQKMPYFIILT